MYKNEVILAGDVYSDIKSFTFENGGEKYSFTIVTKKKWTTRDGQAKEKLEFHNCSVLDKRLYTDVRGINKGNFVELTGEMQTRSYEKTQGDKRYFTEVIVNKFNVINTTAQAEEFERSMNPIPASAPAPAPVQAPQNDLPF